jgi:hypothetical protein
VLGPLANVSPSILDLYHVNEIGDRSTGFANSLISVGRVNLCDIPEDSPCNAKGKVGPNNERQRIQVKYTRDNREWYDPELFKVIGSLKYPLHFIDFETITLSVPYHSGMHPYEDVAFQWSCHRIRDPDRQPEHREWINVSDAFPNFTFVQSLMDCIGSDGSVLMWAIHENTILTHILEQMRRRKFADQVLGNWLREIIHGGTAAYKSADWST